MHCAPFTPNRVKVSSNCLIRRLGCLRAVHRISIPLLPISFRVKLRSVMEFGVCWRKFIIAFSRLIPIPGVIVP